MSAGLEMAQAGTWKVRPMVPTGGVPARCRPQACLEACWLVEVAAGGLMVLVNRRLFPQVELVMGKSDASTVA